MTIPKLLVKVRSILQCAGVCHHEGGIDFAVSDTLEQQRHLMLDRGLSHAKCESAVDGKPHGDPIEITTINTDDRHCTEVSTAMDSDTQNVRYAGLLRYLLDSAAASTFDPYRLTLCRQNRGRREADRRAYRFDRPDRVSMPSGKCSTPPAPRKRKRWSGFIGFLVCFSGPRFCGLRGASRGSPRVIRQGGRRDDRPDQGPCDAHLG